MVAADLRVGRCEPETADSPGRPLQRFRVLLQKSWLEPAVSGRRPATGIYRFGASGMIEAGDVPRNSTDAARAVWPCHGARVASRRWAILRGGAASVHPTAGGHKAINPGGLGAKPPGNHQLLWMRTSILNSSFPGQSFSMMAAPLRRSGRTMARRLPLLRLRISRRPYFIIARRVRPIPNAKPVYSCGSMLPNRRTLG